MGPTAALIAATSVSAIGQLAGGAMGSSAYKNEAKLLDAQGDLAMEDARQAAIQKARDVRQFQAQQGHAYLSSGVTLEGTPVQVMEDTRKKGQQEVDALMKRGAATRALYQAKAKESRGMGRASFLSGLLGATSTGLSSYYSYKTAGLRSQYPNQVPYDPSAYNMWDY